MHATSAENIYNHQEQFIMVFANHSEYLINPLTVKHAQKDNAVLKKQKHDKCSTQSLEDTHYHARIQDGYPQSSSEL